MRNWSYVYKAILLLCFIFVTIGFKFGLVYESIIWKIIVGVCAGFGVSAVMHLKKSFQF
jgi:hypothetical protein